MSRLGLGLALTVAVIGACRGADRTTTPVPVGEATPPSAAVPPAPAAESTRWVAELEIDAADPRSIDRATAAAEALGNARHVAGVPALIRLVERPTTARLVTAQVTAIRALGRFASERDAGKALTALIAREPPPRPTAGADRERVIDYTLFLSTTGAAINAVGELRDASAITPLLVATYRVPELAMQIRRAVVAIGGGAPTELRAILRGEHAQINQLFATHRLDRYCGPDGKAACQPLSAKDFYAAVLLGDFYDAAAVPDLLAALKRPAAPVYVVDDEPSPNTQHAAIFDALRKLGAPATAPIVRAIWRDVRKDLATRVLAIGAYAFVTRDDVGLDELGTITADNRADEALRWESATAYARISHDARGIALMNTLAKRYLDASAKHRADADGKPHVAAVAADKVLAAAKQRDESMRAALLAMTQDAQATTDQIRAATAAARQATDDHAAAKRVHRDKTAAYRQLDRMARDYLAFARVFQTHIARIEIAIRCTTDRACFAASLDQTPDGAAAKLARYITDVASWTADEKHGLVAAAIERAMLELGKQGAAAEAQTATLLDHAGSEDRLIRQSILLALPRIAKRPCASCVAKLDAAIRAGEGKAELASLGVETTIVRNHFAHAQR